MSDTAREEAIRVLDELYDFPHGYSKDAIDELTELGWGPVVPVPTRDQDVDWEYGVRESKHIVQEHRSLGSAQYEVKSADYGMYGEIMRRIPAGPWLQYQPSPVEGNTK